MNIGLAGELDLAAFRLAWVALMQRHAVLRTAFLWEELDDAYQVILKEVDLPLREVDLRGHSQGWQPSRQKITHRRSNWVPPR